LPSPVGGDLLLGCAALHLCLEESMRNNCLRGPHARVSLPPARLPAAGLSLRAKKRKEKESPLITDNPTQLFPDHGVLELIAACLFYFILFKKRVVESD